MQGVQGTRRAALTHVAICMFVWTCVACDIMRTKHGAILTRSDGTTSCTAGDFERAKLQRYVCTVGTGALAVEFRGHAYRDDETGRDLPVMLHPGCQPEFWADGVADTGCRSGVRMTGAPAVLRGGNGTFTITYQCTRGLRDVKFTNTGADAQQADDMCTPVDERVDAQGTMDFSLRHGTDDDGTTITVIGLDAQTAADVTFNFLHRVDYYTPHFTTGRSSGIDVGGGCA